MNTPVPTYCTPEEVAATLDLPDPHDHYGSMGFNDLSHPSYDQVCRMICSNEDIIDRRIRRTWRQNYVIDQQLSVQDYWGDINGWRSDYYQRGGHYIQLRKDVRPWDPTPIYSEEESETTVSKDVGDSLTVGEQGTISLTLKGMILTKTEITDESGETTGYTITYNKLIYPGDKLEIRSRNNVWMDMSDSIVDMEVDHSMPANAGPSSDTTYCYIDYQYGKIYMRTRLYQQKANAVRVSYRYGSLEDPPAAINRMCCLMTAIQVLNMMPFFVKVGQSGDLGSVRQEMIKMWTDEINSIYSSFQRIGSVHTMW